MGPIDVQTLTPFYILKIVSLLCLHYINYLVGCVLGIRNRGWSQLSSLVVSFGSVDFNRCAIKFVDSRLSFPCVGCSWRTLIILLPALAPGCSHHLSKHACGSQIKLDISEVGFSLKNLDRKVNFSVRVLAVVAVAIGKANNFSSEEIIAKLITQVSVSKNGLLDFLAYPVVLKF